MKNFIATAALATALAFPMMAQAVTTVNVGDEIIEQQVLTPGSTAEFDFAAGANLLLTDIALSGNGINGGDDLSAVTFVVTRATDPASGAAGFEDILVFGGTLSVGGSDLGNITLFSGDALQIVFNDGITSNVDVRVAFNAVAPVPLPAAGGMLLTGLFAAGFVARRKKKKAA